MSWIPAFEIGIWNAWWFMCVYLLQWVAVVLAGPKVSQRTDHPADMEQTRADRRWGMAATITWGVATFYSIFLPFHLGTAWFYTGLAFFMVGLAILITGTISFASAPKDKPVTACVLRYTRHPMYLSMFFIYIGVSFAAASWLFFLITVATVVLQRRTAICEENYCLNKYGDGYREYMDRTHRWIGLPKKV